MTDPTGQAPVPPEQTPPAYPGTPPAPYPGAAPAPYPGTAPEPYAPATAYGPPGYPQPGYPQYQYAPAPPANNQKALVSMILGLVGLFTWITSIPAIIFGHMARKELRTSGESGHGMALTGLILGYVIGVGGILLIAAYVIFVVAIVASTAAY